MSEENSISIPNAMPEPATARDIATPEAPKSFIESLPEEYRDKPAFQKYNNMEEFAKGFSNLQSMLSQKQEFKPADDAPKEEWDKFYNKLGRPETVDGYEIKYPEGVETSEEGINQLKQVAHETGLTPQQVEKLVAFDAERQTANSTAFQEKVAAYEAEQKAKLDEALTKHFGDRKDAVIERGDEIAAQYLPEGLEEGFQSLDVDTKLMMFSILDGVYNKDIREGNTVNGDISPAKSMDEMQAQATELAHQIRGMSPLDGRRDALIAQRLELYNKMSRVSK